MKRIRITNNINDIKYIYVDNKDYHKIVGYSWYAWKNKSGNIYVRRKKSTKENNKLPKQILLHRQILGLLFNKKRVTDHINPARWFDNRRINLRICTHLENNQNSRRIGKNGYKGIYKTKSGYYAKIINKGKDIYIGHYKNKKEAAKAYDEAARKYFGNFARLNFPIKGEQSNRRKKLETTNNK